MIFTTMSFILHQGFDDPDIQFRVDIIRAFPVHDVGITFIAGDVFVFQESLYLGDVDGSIEAIVRFREGE